MSIADEILRRQDKAREHQAIYLGLKVEIAMLRQQPKAAEQYRRQLDGVNAQRLTKGDAR